MARLLACNKLYRVSQEEKETQIQRGVTHHMLNLTI